MNIEKKKHLKNSEFLGFPLKRRLGGPVEAPIYSFQLTIFDVSASWSDFEKPR